MNVFYSYSKTDLKLRYDSCIKFQLFEGAQHVYSRLMAVYCMLLPHNPYRLPQHYKRHVCGPSCSCKLQFLSISIVWSIWLKYATDNLFGQQFLFFSQASVDISTHSELQGKRQTKASCVSNSITYWKNCAVAMCPHINQGFWRWRGSILTTQKNPDLHGSCSLPKHCSITDTSEQNSSKLRHTACDVFRSHLALKS
jgi:hypothetical protein